MLEHKILWCKVVTWLCWKQMIGHFDRNYVNFFVVCIDAGINVKLDLPDVTKVSRKTNDM